MIEKLSTGVEGLDVLANGGFLRGSAYILQGPPGAGKTILANQFCFHHVRAGGRALYMSLLAESHQRMIAYIGELQFFDGKVLPSALQYVSGYGVLEREGLGGFLKLVQHEIKRHRATALVLDGIFVAQTAVSPADFRKFVHELQGIATFSNAILLMLTHQTRDFGSPEHTMVDGWIELCDEMEGFRSYRTIQIRKQRGGAAIRGKHPFRITERGITVFPRLETAVSLMPATHATTARIGTGITDLDRVLCGGLPATSSTLVLGPTGSGKTTIGLHFLSQATVEEPGLMLGFYESPARLAVKAGSIGVDFERLMRSGALEVLWHSPAENVVDQLAWEVIGRARQAGVKRVFVDGIAVLRDNLIKKERLPAVLNALSVALREIGATVLYTFELRDIHVPDVMPNDQISSIVDNLILLSYGRQEGAMRRQLSIVKLRDGDFDPHSQEIHVGSNGVAFGPDPRIAIRAETR